MNDLAAPLLLVLGNEIEAFWAFAQYMKRMVDQTSHQFVLSETHDRY